MKRISRSAIVECSAEAVYALMNTNARSGGVAQGPANAARLADVLRRARVDATGTG